MQLDKGIYQTKSWFYYSHTYLIVIYFLLSNLFKLIYFGIEASFTEILVSIVLPFLGCFLLCGFTLRYSSTKIKTSLYLTLLMSIILLYSIWNKLLSQLIPAQQLLYIIKIDPRITLLGTLLIIFSILIYGIHKSKKSFKTLAGYTTLLVFALSIYSFINIPKAYEPRLENGLNLESKTSKQKSTEAFERPDIYYIILDCYTSNASLKKYWNFDNRRFTDSLKNMGFYMADKSKANYNCTIGSLSASLNSSYLDIPDNSRLKAFEVKQIENFIKFNSLLPFFERNNYDLNIYSNLNFEKQKAITNGIFPGVNYKDSRILNTSSIFSPVRRSIIRKYDKRYQQLLRNFYDYSIGSFDFLDALNTKRGNSSNPLFVYSHSVATHPPFVVDENGSFKNNQGNFGDDKKGYIDAIKYSNKRILSFLEEILSRPGKKPIIIIQGDHGSGLNNLDETSTILNAYYFPDRNYKTLYPSLSPVNSFRVVLNKYFYMSIPLLADKSYHVLVSEPLEQ